jgi:hypothetical protein
VGKVIFLALVIFLGYAWYQGWLGKWVESAFITSKQELEKARPANPRADKKD